MLISKLTRRNFVTLSAAAGAVAALPSSVFALNDAQAKALIDKAVADINKVISSGKSLDRMIKDFEKIFVKYGDVSIIARSALGPDARGLSKSQLNSYTKAFQGYISRKYGKRFNEFVGGKVEVTGGRQVKSFYEVNAKVTLRGQKPFQVAFLVSDKSGKDKFFNMFIEGVNLLLTERTEIGAMLDHRKGNIDKLISDLKKLS